MLNSVMSSSIDVQRKHKNNQENELLFLCLYKNGITTVIWGPPSGLREHVIEAFSLREYVNFLFFKREYVNSTFYVNVKSKNFLRDYVNLSLLRETWILKLAFIQSLQIVLTSEIFIIWCNTVFTSPIPTEKNFLRTNLLEKRQNEDRKASTTTNMVFRQTFLFELPVQNKKPCNGERHLIILQKTPIQQGI